MKNKFYTFAFFLIIGCISNKDSNIDIVEVKISKSTIPEGIAVHPESKEIFLSSIHEDRITKSSIDGKFSEEILNRKSNGYSYGVGMDIWNNKLYALGKVNRSHKSILSIVDLETNEVSTFGSNSIDTTYFNDLAIDVNGNCYITDTDNHNIYLYNSSTEEIEIFMNIERIRYPNGIAISSDGSKLFIDSFTSGIKIVDIKTKQVLNEDHEPTTKKGIDGLKYKNGNLYYIKNGGSQKAFHGLYKIKLSEDETALSEPIGLLINHERMDIPTTIAIVNEFIYILANSQLDKLDQEENIKSDATLDHTFILKYQIKDID